MIDIEALQAAPKVPESLDPDRQAMLAAFALDSVMAAEATPQLTKAQVMSLVVSFAGLKAPTFRDETLTLVYTDESSGISNYQTACAPSFTEDCPFDLAVDDGDNPTSATITHPDTGTVIPVRVHARIRDTSNHHYSRVNSKFEEMPTAVIASPRSTCAAACSGCSRGAIGFTKPNRNYVEEHVAQLAAEYDGRGWDRADLASVNITTGSQPTEEKEVAMMVNIMDAYHRLGFSKAGFHLYNYALRSRQAMEAVQAAGAIGYIGTLETANEELRRKYWGRVKGGQSLDEHFQRYETAKDVGFKIVETNYVVGLDPYQEMIDTIELLDKAGVAVVPNIQRRYNVRQFDSTHADVWEKGLAYIAEGFDACLRSYRHPTIKQFAGEATIKWLVDNDPNNTLTDFTELPIRHT